MRRSTIRLAAKYPSPRMRLRRKRHLKMKLPPFKFGNLMKDVTPFTYCIIERIKP